jgi:hypothetical protein
VGTQGLYHSSAASSTARVSNDPSREMVDPSIEAITEPSVSTYLQPGTELSSVSPLVLYASSSLDSTVTSKSQVLLYPAATEKHLFSPVSSTDSLHLPNTEVFGKRSVKSDGKENVPVMKSTLISEIGDENQDFSEIKNTTMSINGVAKNAAANDNSFVVTSSKDVNNITSSVYSSSEGILSKSSNISFDHTVDTENSYIQGMDKPFVNISYLITRDLRNNSETSLTTSSPISFLTSHTHGHPSPLYLPLLGLNLPIARTGKSADYFPSQLHPHMLSTFSTSPSKDGPDTVSFPSDTVQGYKQGPRNSDESLNPTQVKAAIRDSDVSQHEKSDSKVIWISRISQGVGMAPESREMVPAAEHERSSARISHLEDAEMADSPYIPPENSTIIGARKRTFGSGVTRSPSVSSHDLDLPTDKAENGTDNKPLDSDLTTGSGEKEILKITPPLMTSSKVVNTPSQGGRQSDNITKISYVSPVNLENTNGNASLGSATDNANFSTVISEGQSPPLYTKSSVLTWPSIVPGLKQVDNVTTAAKDIEENETAVTTVLPTVMPVSDGRVAAAAPGGSHHGLDAASITGISLGILVFAALVGKIFSDMILIPCLIKEICFLKFVLE